MLSPNSTPQLDWERLLAPPPPRPADADDADWSPWLRRLAPKRRSFDRAMLWELPRQRRALLAQLTCRSFQLDGHAVTEPMMLQAISPGAQRRELRSRLTQRLRNHLAILQQIELDLHHRKPLRPPAVVRWYTSVSSGLSSAALGDGAHRRLEDLLRRINAGQLRLAPAIQECARLHLQLLSDPLVPSFNRILARLLLHFHLGRCNLPPVSFAADDAHVDQLGEARFAVRLLQLADAAYDTLAAMRADGA
jgi:hypothetical protein